MRGPGRREGFILVSVLGALIVLTGLAAAVAYMVRTSATGAAAVRDRLTVDALVHAGLELAGYELFALKRPASVINGQQIRFDDGVVTLFAIAESGKIDLNAATPQILAGLWTSIGAPGLLPEQFAARVIDYRDRDNNPGDKGGAELPQYQAAGPDRLPANAPFEQPDEIQNVLGVTPQAALMLAPLLTVHNTTAKVSAYDAPPEVIRALPGGAAVVDKVMALRSRPPTDDGDDDADKEAQQALGQAAQLFSFERTSLAYTVRIEVARGDAVKATQVILTRSRAPDALYFVTDLIQQASR